MSKLPVEIRTLKGDEDDDRERLVAEASEDYEDIAAEEEEGGEGEIIGMPRIDVSVSSLSFSLSVGVTAESTEEAEAALKDVIEFILERLTPVFKYNV